MPNFTQSPTIAERRTLISLTVFLAHPTHAEPPTLVDTVFLAADSSYDAVRAEANYLASAYDDCRVSVRRGMKALVTVEVADMGVADDFRAAFAA